MRFKRPTFAAVKTRWRNASPRSKKILGLSMPVFVIVAVVAVMWLKPDLLPKGLQDLNPFKKKEPNA